MAVLFNGPPFLFAAMSQFYPDIQADTCQLINIS